MVRSSDIESTDKTSQPVCKRSRLAGLDVASDFDTEYTAVAEYLDMLCKRAYSHVGLKIPYISSSSAVDTGSDISRTNTSMAYTGHGESIKPVYPTDVSYSGLRGDDQLSHTAFTLQEIWKLKEQRDRTRKLTAERTRRYYARRRAEKEKSEFGSKTSGSTT